MKKITFLIAALSFLFIGGFYFLRFGHYLTGKYYDVIFHVPIFLVNYILPWFLLSVFSAASFTFLWISIKKTWLKWSLIVVMILGVGLVASFEYESSDPLYRFPSYTNVYKLQENQQGEVVFSALKSRYDIRSAHVHLTLKKASFFIFDICEEIDRDTLPGTWTVYDESRKKLGTYTKESESFTFAINDNIFYDWKGQIRDALNDDQVWIRPLYAEGEVFRFSLYNNGSKSNKLKFIKELETSFFERRDYISIKGDKSSLALFARVNGVFYNGTITSVNSDGQKEILLSLNEPGGHVVSVAMDSTTGFIQWSGIPGIEPVMTVNLKHLGMYEGLNLQSTSLYNYGEEYGEDYLEEPVIEESETEQALCNSLDDCSEENPWKKTVLYEFVDILPDRVTAIVKGKKVYYYVSSPHGSKLIVYIFQEGKTVRELTTLEPYDGNSYTTGESAGQFIVEVNGRRFIHDAGSDGSGTVENTNVTKHIHTYPDTIKVTSSDAKYTASRITGDKNELKIYNNTQNDSVLILSAEGSDWYIESLCFSPDGKSLFFDNHGQRACIWMVDVESRRISKIIPEHEAHSPFAYVKDKKIHLVYLEGTSVIDATPKNPGSPINGISQMGRGAMIH